MKEFEQLHLNFKYVQSTSEIRTRSHFGQTIMVRFLNHLDFEQKFVSEIWTKMTIWTIPNVQKPNKNWFQTGFIWFSDVFVPFVLKYSEYLNTEHLKSELCWNRNSPEFRFQTVGLLELQSGSKEFRFQTVGTKAQLSEIGTLWNQIVVVPKAQLSEIWTKTWVP